MADQGTLGDEFAVFAAYLGARDADARAAARYAAAHASLPLGGDTLDRWLLAVARRGHVACALADAYARRVRPYGVLRRKLVLTLAVLESGRATHARFDEPLPASLPLTLAALALSGVAWLARTALAVVFFAPLHLAAALAPQRRDG